MQKKIDEGMRDAEGDTKEEHRLQLTDSYYMGLQKRSSIHFYNRNLGHTFLVGGDTKKIVDCQNFLRDLSQMSTNQKRKQRTPALREFP